MADLFQSEYDVGSLRRGVQDGETLWKLLAEDGTVTIVPDPGQAEVEAAQKELTKLIEAGEEDDAEAEAERQTKIAQLSRTSSFQPAVEAEEEQAEEKSGNGRRKETAEAKS